MSDITVQVAELIKQARRAQGLTQEELAQKLGIRQVTVNRYETGKQNLTVDTIQKIAIALKTDINVNFKA